MGSSCSNSSTEQNSKKRTNQNNNQIAKVVTHIYKIVDRRAN